MHHRIMDFSAGRTIRLVIPLSFLLMLLSSAFSATQAQTSVPWNGARCYKVKDSQNYRATLDLSGAYFGESLDCRAKVRARYLCEPSTALVTSSTAPPGETATEAASVASICYKLRCSGSGPIGSVVIADQFGTRALSRLKTSLFCQPVGVGNPFDITFSVQQSAYVAALQFDVDLSAVGGRFDVFDRTVVCERDPALPEDAVFDVVVAESGVRGIFVAPSVPLTTPSDIATCRFLSLGAVPTTASLLVATTEAVDDQFGALSGVTVEISAVTEVNP